MSNNTIQFPDSDFLTPVGIAGQARNDVPPVKPAMTLEAETGKKVVSPLNAKSILSIKNKKEHD